MDITKKETKVVRMNCKEVEDAITEKLKLFDLLTPEDVTIKFEHDCGDDYYYGCKITVERIVEQSE